MVIHPLMSFQSMPAIGNFIGSRTNETVVHEINNILARNGGGTIFAQNSSMDVQEHMQMFFHQVLEPERVASQQFMTIIGNSLMDGIRPITSVEDLENGIPVCMFEPILTYPPIRERFDNQSIYGFGMQQAELPIDDVWGRLINNGQVDLSEPDEDGGYEMKWEFHLDDPDWTIEDLNAVKMSRAWLEEFMTDTNLDVTNYPNKIVKLKD